jgi:hypothetical protein
MDRAASESAAAPPLIRRMASVRDGRPECLQRSQRKIGDINDVIVDKAGKVETSSWALAAFSVWGNTMSLSLTTS